MEGNTTNVDNITWMIFFFFPKSSWRTQLSQRMVLDTQVRLITVVADVSRGCGVLAPGSRCWRNPLCSLLKTLFMKKALPQLKDAETEVQRD